MGGLIYYGWLCIIYKSFFNAYLYKHRYIFECFFWASLSELIKWFAWGQAKGKCGVFDEPYIIHILRGILGILLLDFMVNKGQKMLNTTLYVFYSRSKQNMEKSLKLVKTACQTEVGARSWIVKSYWIKVHHLDLT